MSARVEMLGELSHNTFGRGLAARVRVGDDRERSHAAIEVGVTEQVVQHGFVEPE